MTWTIDYSKSAMETLKKWAKSNPLLMKKTKKVLNAILEQPKSGIGHPEPLVGGDGITYSRRITGQHRIIYDIYEDEVRILIIEMEGHYDDK